MTRYNPLIADAQRRLDRVTGIVSEDVRKEAQLCLDTSKELNMVLDRQDAGRAAIASLIEMGLSEAFRNIPQADRLADSYYIADRARAIEAMAQQLQNAEAIFESEDLGDDDVREIARTLEQVEREMELSEPTPTQARDEAFARATLGCRDPECFEHNGSR